MSAMNKSSSPLSADGFYGQPQMHMRFLTIQFFLFFVNGGLAYYLNTLAAMLKIKVKRIICCVLGLENGSS